MDAGPAPDGSPPPLRKSRLSRLDEFSHRGVDADSQASSPSSTDALQAADATVVDAWGTSDVQHASSPHRSGSRRHKHGKKRHSARKIQDLELAVESLRSRTVQLEFLLQQKDAAVVAGPGVDKEPVTDGATRDVDGPHVAFSVNGTKQTAHLGNGHEAAQTAASTRNRRGSGTDRLYADVKEIMETADKADLANLYSYAIEESLARPMSIGTVLRVIFLFALSGVQVIFAYGFYDASRLLARQRGFPAYRDPVDMSLMYPVSLIGGWLKIPIVNFLSSLVSLVLLALLMKNDTEGACRSAVWPVNGLRPTDVRAARAPSFSSQARCSPHARWRSCACREASSTSGQTHRGHSCTGQCRRSIALC
jgi:hypothetical protein